MTPVHPHDVAAVTDTAAANPTPGMRLEGGWVIPIEPAGAVLADHAVVVQADRIAAVLPREQAAEHYPELSAVDLSDHILIPGLVNAHTHAAMTLFRGCADDLALADWLQQRIWPAEARLVTPEFVAGGTRLACLEMVRGGVTMFADMYFYPDEAIAAALSAGIRMNVGLVYLTVPTNYAKDQDDYLRKGLQVWRRWHDHPQVRFSLAPHATYSTTPESMQAIPGLCSEYDLGVHTHLHETAQEVTDEKRDFGMTGVARLQQAGALGDRFFGAHGVHLDAEDIQILADTGSSVVHCPSSNLKLGSGVAPIAELLAAGVNVGLGTDGAASNNRLDLWQEMRTAALLAKGITGDPTVLPAHQALRMATLAGAQALGRGDDLGSLTPGKQADVVAVSANSLAGAPIYDPASALVYALGREQVTHVWVAGRQVVAEGVCTTVNEHDALNSANEWLPKVRGD
jgi:5-methylthioadenosine/S-adenosylhomocysteine deaminase